MECERTNDTLHFPPSAAECLGEGKEEEQAFSGYMERSVPLHGTTPPPSYSGIQGATQTFLSMGSGHKGDSCDPCINMPLINDNEHYQCSNDTGWEGVSGTWLSQYWQCCPELPWMLMEGSEMCMSARRASTCIDAHRHASAHAHVQNGACTTARKCRD